MSRTPSLVERTRIVLDLIDTNPLPGNLASVMGDHDDVSVHLTHGGSTTDALLAWFYLLDEPVILCSQHLSSLHVHVEGTYKGVKVVAWTGFYRDDRVFLEAGVDWKSLRDCPLSVHRLRNLQVQQRSGGDR